MPHILAAAATALSALAPAAVGGGAAAGTATLTSTMLNIATNVALSMAMSALQPQVGMAGRTFEFVIDPDGPIPFAAGRIGVSGSVVHRDTFGPDLMYYGIPGVLSGAGPIDGYESFKADDELVTFDGTGKAITSQYANELWYKNKLGTQPDTALTTPTGLKDSVTLPDWGPDHKLSAKACFLIVMGENSKQTAYPTGEIKPLITLRGLKVWDPRLDDTWPGGVGPQRLDDPSTWVYSDNPILWALKWSLGLWEGPTGKGAPQVDYQVGGIGAKLSGIDVPAFISAANIADANGWTCSAYPNTDDDKAQVLDAFLQAGGCIYAQRAGKISCIQRAAPRSSIVTVSAADTAGPLEIDTAASRIDRINTIRPRFWSEEHRWQLTAQPEVSIAAYVTEDGAKRTRGIDWPFVNNSAQAGQLAALQIANTREGVAGVIPLKPHLQRIRPGDAFTITEPGFVLDGLKCLCMNTDYDPATGVVRVSFVSETDGKYDYALGLTPEPPETQVLTPPGFAVTPPQVGEWTAVAGTIDGDDGAEVPAIVLTGTVDNDVVDSVIFEYRRVGAASWMQAGTDGPQVQSKQITGLAPGEWESAVSYRRGRRTSDRLVLDAVTLTGILVPLTPGVLDDANVMRRPGGGGLIYTGDLDAVGGTYVDNTVGTLENDLITGAVRPLQVLDQGPLATFTPPTYAGNTAAYAALGAGKPYLDSTNSDLLATTYGASAAPGSGAKPLSGSAGSTVASATISSITAGSLVEIVATFNAPALTADAAMTGYIRFEEGTGGTWTQIGDDVPVTVNSGGLSLPGPSWSGDRVTEDCSGFGVRSGSVTYRATFTRTGGSSLYGAGYQMSGSVKITPLAA